MELCEACADVAKALSLLIAGGHNHPLSKKPIRHGRDFSELETSSAACRLCRLLLVHNPIEKPHGQHLEKPLDLLTGGYAIELSPKWDFQDGLDRANSRDTVLGAQRSLKWLHVRILRKSATEEERSQSNEKRWPIILQIYGLRDTPPVSTGSLWSRYRFRSSASADALSLLRQWLQTCLRDHQRCKCDDLIASTERIGHFKLPTRVIDVGPSDGSCQPRLLITNGKRGSWVALSHCWGKPALRPPKTTKENLQARLRQIHLDDMPKSFQDAVTVTRALDVRYLWIDSLSIVQDDHEDWRRECETMGLVYRNALVTISAADATDSTQGLFSDTAGLSYARLRREREDFREKSRCVRRGAPWEQTGESRSEKEWEGSIGEGIPAVIESVEIPYGESDLPGSFYIAPKDDFVVEPMESPLFERGWVTQEWVLSRRNVLFLKDAVIWACRESNEDERGNLVVLERPSVLDWQSLVETYTRNHLTFESDRLAAVRGLANSLQGSRPDKYFAGLWMGDLPEALAWVKPPGHPISAPLAHLPSWTWARTTGPVGFQLTTRPQPDASGDPRLERACTVIGIGSSGGLDMVGMIRKVSNMVEFVYKPKFEEFSDAEWDRQEMDACFLKRCFSGQANCRQSIFGSLYRKGLSILLHPSGSRLGWAAWDDGRQPETPIYCLALVLERTCMKPILAVEESVSDAYHVLFVKREPLSTERFVRVGVGVVVKNGWIERAQRRSAQLV